MKISKISVWQIDLPLHEGDYKWSGGKSVETFDTTVVEIQTDEGVAGYGEACPLGPVYLPSYAAGVRAGIRELGPNLLGGNPLHLEKLNQEMDRAMKGHPYVKSPLDVACWDILGKVSQLPVSTLLGGSYGEDFVLYRAISQESPEEMAQKVSDYREEGYRRFQLKVGGDPDTDIERIRQAHKQLQPGDKLVADANTGWLRHDAMRVVNAIGD
ncbi:MAG: enolase C-terminal domain-like protein, partial [Opitutae bacterium]